MDQNEQSSREKLTTSVDVSVRKNTIGQTEQTDSVQTKKDDLRSVLAALTAESNSLQKPETKQEKPQQVNERRAIEGQKFRDDRSKRQVDNPKSTSVQTAAERSNPIAAVTPLEIQPRRQQQFYQEPTSAQPEVTKVAETPAEVKQSDHVQIGGIRQPAFAPVEQEAQPDIAKVKQMLRSSGKERPPGL